MSDNNQKARIRSEDVVLRKTNHISGTGRIITIGLLHFSIL